MKKHLLALFTGFDSLASLPRVWMALFGFATLVAAIIVLHHLLGLKDPAALLAWKDILVAVLPWTLSICALPFTVSKACGSLEAVVQSLSGRKKDQ